MTDQCGYVTYPSVWSQEEQLMVNWKDSDPTVIEVFSN